MYLKHLLYTGLLIVLFTGCNATEAPFKSEARILIGNFAGLHARVPEVTITATSEKVLISNVIANKGNCRMTAIHSKNFPKELKYGESVKAVFVNGCNLLQIEVVADEQNWLQEFDYIPEVYVQM